MSALGPLAPQQKAIPTVNIIRLYGTQRANALCKQAADLTQRYLLDTVWRLPGGLADDTVGRLAVWGGCYALCDLNRTAGATTDLAVHTARAVAAIPAATLRKDLEVAAPGTVLTFYLHTPEEDAGAEPGPGAAGHH